MTTADLTVYGRPVGSLWDRRIGGRYELVEITDTGGTGIYVTLQRVDGGQLLTVSVYNLGRNYVPVPEAEPVTAVEDLTGIWRDRKGYIRCVVGPHRPGVEVWDATDPGRVVASPPWQVSTSEVRSWTRVPEKAEPAEDGRALPYDAVDLAPVYLDVRPNVPWPRPPAVPEPILPSDVPLAAWEIEHLNRERPIEQFDGVDFGDLIRIGGEALYRVVDADGKPILEPEPAPTPLLPWAEPDAAPYWRHKAAGSVTRLAIMLDGGIDTADDWEPVAVIPRDLIEKAKRLLLGGYSADAIQAILDAADEVTS